MHKILNFVKPGVVTGYDMQKIFTIAKKNKFAIPAINCISTDSINAVLEAAEKFKTPIIIQFSNGGAKFIAGNVLQNDEYSKQRSDILGSISGANHVHLMAKEYGIPVILHTDHCSKKLLPWIDGLLDISEDHFKKTGKPFFSSHMIDLSQEPLKDNINICSKYLKRMSKLDITLEIEIGSTGGEEDGIDNSHLNTSNLYSRPEDIEYAFKILRDISPNFTIAATFGNVHGVYKPGNIKLIPSILDHSQKLISKKYILPDNSLNFVFHGGSGSSIEKIKEAINYGIVKINIDTDIQWATWNGIFQFYKRNFLYLQTQLGNPEGIDKPNKKYYDPRAWIRSAQVSLIECLEKYFQNLNCINRL